LVEKEIRNTLAHMLAQAVEENQKFRGGKIDPTAYMQWLDRFPVSNLVIYSKLLYNTVFQAQIIVLSAQIAWSEEVEAALSQNSSLENTAKTVEATLNLLADSVLQEQPALRRKKLEHLVSSFRN
jgi:dynein heavy chain 1, cytosolic